MSEPTDKQRAEQQEVVSNVKARHEGGADVPCRVLALIVERDAALAEAAMAGAAEDGAMQSANDLVQRLDKAEAELTKANEENRFLREQVEHWKHEAHVMGGCYGDNDS